MQSEPVESAVSAVSGKARWAVRLLVCSVFLLLCPCVLPILREGFSLVTGLHVHPHAAWFNAALTGCVIAAVVLCLVAIVLGVLALREVRRSVVQLPARTEAIVATWGAVILLALVAAVLPMIASARESARRTQCKCYMKQLGLAFHNYHDKFQSFPPYAICDAAGKPLLSWRVAILPFLEETRLYNQFHLDEPWDSPHNLTLVDRMPPPFRCPSDFETASHASTYVIVAGPGTYFPFDGTTRIKDVKDGSSLSFMVTERAGNQSPWTSPDHFPFAALTGPGDFASGHSGGWQVLMGDGTCRFVRDQTSPALLRGLYTIAGGEPIDEDDF